jgi:lipoyl(octanoyl) transferase
MGGSEAMISVPRSCPFKVYLLGQIGFEETQALQRRLVYDLGETGGGALLLCEHPPTISVGRSGSRMHIVPDNDELRERGIRVYWVNRGGGCVLHLPGQVTGYLALPLDQLGISVGRYLDLLHQALIEMLKEFDLHGQRHAHAPGVFLGNARVASVGIAVNRWMAYHGFTLNVGPYLDPFDLLEEPEIVGQTSMEARRQRPAPMPRVREALVRNVELAFGLESHSLFTDHPLIRRRARHHAYASSVG